MIKAGRIRQKWQQLPQFSVSVTSSGVAIGWSPAMEAGSKLKRLIEVVMELM